MSYINQESRQSLRQPKTGYAVAISIGDNVHTKIRWSTPFTLPLDKNVRRLTNRSIRNIVIDITVPILRSSINSL